MIKLHLIATVLYLIVQTVKANDILGCGGYIKSDVEISFAEVGIKLYTRQGNLKYETDCAPNNGYYFIPLYDKGEYVLKVAPPPGWSFEPEQVQLKVDGETDPCFLGHDINFHFKGFAVVGKVVSSGSDTGPSGVTVSLFKDDKLVMTTETSDGGSYVFTPLASATYTVVATHPMWKLLQDKVTVKVTDENGDAGSSLIVSGYSISGSVITDGKPTSGVSFILHADGGLAYKNHGCKKGTPKGYSSEISTPALCYVVSDDKGKFVFTTITPGTYTLAPFFHSLATKYEVAPKSLQVVLQHNDVQLPQTFKIEGFSIQGKVQMSPEGPAVANAQVELDNKVTTTDDKGMFIFHSVKSGTQKIQIKADHLQYEPVMVKLNAQDPVIGPFVPSKYEVCFTISLDKTTNKEQLWEVVVESDDKKNRYNKKSQLNQDRCFYLPKGAYTAHVVLPPDADEAGIRFGPRQHVFTIASQPVGKLVFSQFLGVISGNVECLEECPKLSLSLKPVRGGSGGVKNAMTSGGKFSFVDVVPGSYQITIHKEDWCWHQKSVAVTVNTQDVDVSMKQSGYKLTISSSHNTRLSYKSMNNKQDYISVQKGTFKECISQPGVYTFTPEGCHKFGGAPFQWDTNAPSLITLAATHHLFKGKILSKEKANFSVVIKELSSSKVNKLQPLSLSKDNPDTYLFEHWVKEGEKITVTPESDDNLYQYEPSSFAFNMPSDCVENAVTFKAERALFIHGKVLPDISGVTIKVKGSDGKEHTFITDSKGSYTAGPLDNSLEYSISAEKLGYIMKDDAKTGYFEAFKLSEIIVKVTDEAGSPLPGVLVSTSGGKSYRQNSLTEADGTIAFQALMPSDYFLRPIMKEYTFDPASKMVTVEEGATISIHISGSRVAYSVFGQTVSLSGEHETDVTVEAVGVGASCNQYQEEAVSDDKGYFRIRGLLPMCEYDLQLKKDKKINQNVERTVPATRRVKIENNDIKDMRLIVLRPFLQMDVAVKVDTKPQYLSSLVARLYRDDLPDSPIHTMKLGQHPYFLFPPMITDQRTYTFQIESSLPTSQYQYKTPEISFVADSSFKHLSVSFHPTFRNLDAEMNQGTVIGFAVAVFLVIIAFNYKKLGPFIEKLVQVHANMTTSRTSNITFDSPEIEPVTKKRVKSRKT